MRRPWQTSTFRRAVYASLCVAVMVAVCALWLLRRARRRVVCRLQRFQLQRPNSATANSATAEPRGAPKTTRHTASATRPHTLFREGGGGGKRISFVHSVSGSRSGLVIVYCAFCPSDVQLPRRAVLSVHRASRAPPPRCKASPADGLAARSAACSGGRTRFSVKLSVGAKSQERESGGRPDRDSDTFV